ncbi:MAG TPA: Fe-S cluster assembly protein SufD [Flavobacteriales bacterium]|nr:Fe-S cluster assembly protein SufD [Flavobacteriales bacterium]
MAVVTQNTIGITSELDVTSLNIFDADKTLAFDVLKDIVLPTTRIEEWKYTRVAKLGRTKFINSESKVEDISPYIMDETKCSLVFVNGYYSEKLSSREVPKGVNCTPLSECGKHQIPKSIVTIKGEVFSAVNTAYLNDGVLIDIEPSAIISETIQIIHIMNGDSIISNFRVIINAGKFSQSSIVQGFFTEGKGTNFCNNICEVTVEENAFLSIDKIQYESLEASHISTDQVKQNKNSTFTINTLTLNGGLVRNNLNIEVIGQNCTTNLNGAYLLKDKQHVDNHTTVDHTVPNCESNELYKGVIDDNSTAVFNGKVFVRQDAQKINAFQSNSNILLSNAAAVNSKPELEIYADDVKCSHGSTTGQLDEEAIFYLRSRGLSEKKARQLMVSAFIDDVLNKVENKNVCSFVSNLMKERFGWEN